MSLQAVHLVFVTLLTGLALGCGAWKLHAHFSGGGARGDLFWGLVSLAAGVAVICYGRYFLKKLKTVGYR